LKEGTWILGEEGDAGSFSRGRKKGGQTSGGGDGSEGGKWSGPGRRKKASDVIGGNKKAKTLYRAQGRELKEQYLWIGGPITRGGRLKMGRARFQRGRGGGRASEGEKAEPRSKNPENIPKMEGPGPIPQ